MVADDGGDVCGISDDFVNVNVAFCRRKTGDEEISLKVHDCYGKRGAWWRRVVAVL